MSFADITHPDDVDAEAEALDQLVAGERRRYVTEKRYLRADGRLVWVSLSLSPVRDEVGNTLYLISQMQDVTERKRTEAKLAHQAMHDPLTGLPNRTLFTDRMQLAKARLGVAARWRCCSATSTTSRPSTTASGTTRATES